MEKDQDDVINYEDWEDYAKEDDEDPEEEEADNTETPIEELDFSIDETYRGDPDNESDD